MDCMVSLQVQVPEMAEMHDSVAQRLDRNMENLSGGHSVTAAQSRAESKRSCRRSSVSREGERDLTAR